MTLTLVRGEGGHVRTIPQAMLEAFQRGLAANNDAGTKLREVEAVVRSIGHAVEHELRVPCVATLEAGGFLRMRVGSETVLVAECQLAPAVVPIAVIVERRSTTCVDLESFEAAMVATLANPSVAAKLKQAAARRGRPLKAPPMSHTRVWSGEPGSAA